MNFLLWEDFGHQPETSSLSRFLLIGNLLHIYPQLSSLTSVVEIIGKTLNTDIMKRNFSLLSNPHNTITYKDQPSLAFFTPICRNRPCKWKILVLDTKCLSIAQDKKTEVCKIMHASALWKELQLCKTQRRRPLRPPFLRVLSVGMGVTSSAMSHR